MLADEFFVYWHLFSIALDIIGWLSDDATQYMPYDSWPSTVCLQELAEQVKAKKAAAAAAAAKKKWIEQREHILRYI